MVTPPRDARDSEDNQMTKHLKVTHPISPLRLDMIEFTEGTNGLLGVHTVYLTLEFAQGRNATAFGMQFCTGDSPQQTASRLRGVADQIEKLK